MSADPFSACRQLATRIRAHCLRMVHKANASHIGTCLSVADLLAHLYDRVLRVDPAAPGWPDRDYFILSKGHGAAALYAVLAESGFFPVEWLDSYCQGGSLLLGHASHHVPGVEFSTGSLGHGLSVACGLALAARRENRPNRVFVIVSDGELDEGSCWEAILFAQQHKLDNLTVVVDHNRIQSFGRVTEVLDLAPLAAKWEAFRWAVREVDGHDFAMIDAVVRALPFRPGSPSAIIAQTIKGKGVSFMEDRLEWHYWSPSEEQLRIALQELFQDGEQEP